MKRDLLLKEILEFLHNKEFETYQPQLITKEELKLIKNLKNKKFKNNQNNKIQPQKHSSLKVSLKILNKKDLEQLLDEKELIKILTALTKEESNKAKNNIEAMDISIQQTSKETLT